MGQQRLRLDVDVALEGSILGLDADAGFGPEPDVLLLPDDVRHLKQEGRRVLDGLLVADEPADVVELV